MRKLNDLFAWYGLRSRCKCWLLYFGFLLNVHSLFAVQEINVDVCVYGGTAGGVIASVQAARMGKTVALVAPNKHLGGMTTSGLGWTDIGHVDGDSGDYIQGVAREFYNRIGVKYGLFPAQPTFEPHVAEKVFNQMVQAQSRIALYTNLLLVSVVKQGSQILAATMNDGTMFHAKMFIDASFTGDLMARAGVTYTYGRESTNTYGENLNGIRPPNSDFTTLSIDPYVVKGNPASGLLPLIQTNGPGTPGNADQRVQAFNFRLCLTTVASNKLAITAPSGYNTNQYELVARYVQAMVAAGTTPSAATFFTTGTAVPNNKIDANNSGALSTDFVGESAPYVEADDASRAQIWQAHKNYEQGFLYFLGTDLRLPASLRTSVTNYGLCKDEFTDNGGWPYEIYVREGRRMISDYVMTQSNIFNQLSVPDSIGMGGYFTDSHYLQRVVVNGGVRNEGNARGDISVPYPISYRAIVPKTAECSNLFVPWCLSASHTAYSSLRMEPVFMILGQACGTAACFSIDDGVSVQNINIAKLQAQLVADQQQLQTDGVPTGGTLNVASLLLDFGATAVSSTTDKLNDPAHSVGGLSSVQTNWNTTSTISDSTLIYSDGTTAAGVSYTLGRSDANATNSFGVATNINFGNANINITTLTGAATYNSGVYANNSPVKDGVFAIGTSAVSTNALGLRVNGLAAGVYTVYISARNSNLSGSQTEQIYFTNGPSSSNYRFTTSPSVFQTNLYSGGPTTTFTLADNYNVMTINLNANDALYIASIGHTNSATPERRGFLNSVQIVPGLPQTNLPIIQLWATDSNASRSDPTTGTFTISRSGNANVPVTVNLNFGGSATNGTDYLTLNGAVTIAAGVLSTNIKVLPFMGTVPAGDKIATISLASDGTYTVGNLSSATIVIKDTSIHDWQLQYFGSNATNSLIAGDNASPAGDGIPNLVKYALGLNPTSNVAAVSMQPQIVNSYFTFAYTRPDPAPDDITYEIQVSNNLVTWSNNASTIQQIVYNANKTATITSHLSLSVNQVSNQFVRLQVARKNSSKSIQGATVVAFGDSITFGYGLSGSQTWTSQLASRFNLNLINAGVSGNTSSQGLTRIETDVLAQQPDFVIINFGMNDHVMNSLDSPKVSQATFQTNLLTMVDRVRSVGAIPVLVTVNYIIEGDAAQYYYNRHPSSNYSNMGGAQAWLDSYIQIVRNVAAAKGADLVDVRAACDSYNRFDFLRSLTNGAATDDGVHPYIIGANVYAQLIGDYLAGHY